MLESLRGVLSRWNRHGAPPTRCDAPAGGTTRPGRAAVRHFVQARQGPNLNVVLFPRCHGMTLPSYRRPGARVCHCPHPSDAVAPRLSAPILSFRVGNAGTGVDRGWAAATAIAPACLRFPPPLWTCRGAVGRHPRCGVAPTVRRVGRAYTAPAGCAMRRRRGSNGSGLLVVGGGG